MNVYNDDDVNLGKIYAKRKKKDSCNIRPIVNGKSGTAWDSYWILYLIT